MTFAEELHKPLFGVLYPLRRIKRHRRKAHIHAFVAQSGGQSSTVTTVDHDEDWFIFAPTSRSAASYHEDCEGYDRGDAKARLVIPRAELQKYEQGPPPCHAQIADLITLGFEVVGGDPHQRGVRFKGELYVEGHLQALLVQASDKLREALKAGRSNGTRGTTESN